MMDFYFQLLAVCFFGVAMAGYPCCCGGIDCSCCTIAPPASMVYIEFSGVANDSCSNCNDWNGTVFEVPLVNCDYYLDDIDIGCTHTSPAPVIVYQINCQTSPEIDGQLQLLVYTVTYPVGSPVQAIYSGPSFELDVRDCAAAAPHTFTSGQIFNGGATDCDWSSASAVITT